MNDDSDLHQTGVTRGWTATVSEMTATTISAATASMTRWAVIGGERGAHLWLVQVFTRCTTFNIHLEAADSRSVVRDEISLANLTAECWLTNEKMLVIILSAVLLLLTAVALLICYYHSKKVRRWSWNCRNPEIEFTLAFQALISALLCPYILASFSNYSSVIWNPLQTLIVNTLRMRACNLWQI